MNPLLEPIGADLGLHDLDELMGVHERYPLAQVRLWHRDKPRTSQRQVLLEQGEVVTNVFGGNRSGKSFLLLIWVVCMLLGSDHPAVSAFLAANGLPARMPDGRWVFPPGPGDCWLVALSSNDSIEYHRANVDRLLDGCDLRWWNRDGKGEARLQVVVPGYDRIGRLGFKSVDQKRRAFQGTAKRAIGHDEEGEEGVWDECLFRIMDPDPITGEPGRMMQAMTPLRGLRWTHRRYVAEPTEDGARRHWLWTPDNPHMDPEVIARMLARFGDAQRAARERGEFITLEGRIYPQFSRSSHVVRPFPIPPEWPRYRGMDFGVRNPTAVLWGCLSPDDQLIIYREHYQAGWSLKRHAEHIKRMERCESCCEAQQEAGAVCEACGGSGLSESIVRAWADPSGKQQIVDLRREHRIIFRPAKRSVEVGISAVSERLEGVAASHIGAPAPALIIFDTCPKLIREFENYVRAPDTGKKDGPERPLQRDDHAMDALRYLVMGVRRSVGVA